MVNIDVSQTKTVSTTVTLEFPAEVRIIRVPTVNTEVITIFVSDPDMEGDDSTVSEPASEMARWMYTEVKCRFADAFVKKHDLVRNPRRD